MSWWNDVTSWVNEQAKSAGIPGVDTVNRYGGDVGKFLGQQGSNLNQMFGQALTDVIGPGGINPYGSQFKSIWGGGPSATKFGGKSVKDPQTAVPAPTPPPATGQDALFQFLLGKIPQLTYGQANNPTQALIQTLAGDVSGMSPGQGAALIKALPGVLGQDVQKATAPPTTNDAITMGIGMFFQQYLAPMLQQVNQQNQQLEAGAQNMMKQDVNMPLPPGIANIVKGFNPQINQLLGMQNTAGLQAALGTIPFQQLMQGVGGETSALQALQQALQHAATYQALSTGGSNIGSVLGSLFPPGSVGAGVAGLLPSGTSTGVGTPAIPGISPSQIANPAASSPTASTAGSLTQPLANPQVQALVDQYKNNPQALTSLMQQLLAQG